MTNTDRPRRRFFRRRPPLTIRPLENMTTDHRHDWLPEGFVPPPSDVLFPVGEDGAGVQVGRWSGDAVMLTLHGPRTTAGEQRHAALNLPRDTAHRLGVELLRRAAQ